MRVSPFRSSRLLTLALVGVGLACAPSAGAASATASRFVEVPTGISGAAMTDIATAPDGSAWITSTGKGSLFKVVTDGRASERPMTGLGRRPAPAQLAIDATGQLWTTEAGSATLLRSDDLGDTDEFAVSGGSAAAPADLARGADGNVWFSAAADSTLGRVMPDGRIDRFPSPHRPRLLATATDGAVWFTTADGHAGYADAEGAMRFTFVAPGLTGITAGADGTAWLTTATAVYRVDADGQVASFTAGIAAGSTINDIATGADGLLWYSDTTARTVGRVTPEGVITAYATENAAAPGGRGAAPLSLTTDNAGNPVYFGTSEEPLLADVVGQVSPSVTPTGTTPAIADITTSSATISATVNPENSGTSVVFEYGQTTRFGKTTEAVALDGRHLTPQALQTTLTDLEPKRTYYLRVMAVNPRGTFTSPTTQFTTPNIPLPTSPFAPGAPKPSPIASPAAPTVTTPVSASLRLAAAAAKVSAKGVVRLKLSCAPGAACAATVAVTARVPVPAKGKKKATAKTATIAVKQVSIPAGTTANVGLRVTTVGRTALRKAGRKGLSTLAVVTIGPTKTRARLTLRR